MHCIHIWILYFLFLRWIVFCYCINLDDCNSKSFKMTWDIIIIEREEGGVEEWLKEEREGGSDDRGDLLQSEFCLGSLSFQSKSFQSACVDFKLCTSYVYLLSAKATWAQLLKLPAGSTLEIIFSIFLIKKCRTVKFGLPNCLFFIWNTEISLAGTHLHGKKTYMRIIVT